ncbi:MAG: YfcE family phosphodiesterase [Oscillospiraceae bacterium]|nr:YfcE family phosphodiesterase [Oscillospiraceae bacterium]
MRIVVFSDSHGNVDILRQIMQSQPEAEAIIHLGDGERDFDQLRLEHPDKVMRNVRGNSDWGSESKLMDTVLLEGKRIIFAHGHTLNVKQSPSMLLGEAQSAGAQIALFGHTHYSMTDYKDGVYLMNPGSPTQPRRGRATYGVIDIGPEGIATKIIPL